MSELECRQPLLTDGPPEVSGYQVVPNHGWNRWSWWDHSEGSHWSQTTWVRRSRVWIPQPASYFFLSKSPLNAFNCFSLLQSGFIRCKHIVRWQHLSRIKARLLWLVENVFSPIKMQQATSGTSAATYELMEPHCTIILWVRLSNWSQ